jgi:hypothetical protein
MKISIAMAAAATVAVLSVTSSIANASASDIEDIVERENEIMAALSSLHIASSSPARSAPASATAAAVADFEDANGDERQSTAEDGGDVDVTIPFDEAPEGGIGGEEIASIAFLEDEAQEAALGEEHHEMTKREKHHQERTSKAAKVHKEGGTPAPAAGAGAGVAPAEFGAAAAAMSMTTTTVDASGAGRGAPSPPPGKAGKHHSMLTMTATATTTAKASKVGRAGDANSTTANMTASPSPTSHAKTGKVASAFAPDGVAPAANATAAKASKVGSGGATTNATTAAPSPTSYGKTSKVASDGVAPAANATAAKASKVAVDAVGVGATTNATTAAPSPFSTHPAAKTGKATNAVASDGVAELYSASIATAGGKAGKVAKGGNETMTTTYATDYIDVIVYTEGPGGTEDATLGGGSTTSTMSMPWDDPPAEDRGAAAVGMVPSSGSVPRVPDASPSGGAMSNDEVKSKLVEEVKEVMLGGATAAGTATASTTSHHREEPRTSALEVTSGIASSRRGGIVATAVGICLVVSSFAYAMA